MSIRSCIETFWFEVKLRLFDIVEAIDRWLDLGGIDCDLDELDGEEPIVVLGLTFERAPERDWFGTAWWNADHAIELSQQYDDGRWWASTWTKDGEDMIDDAEGLEAEDALCKVFRIMWQAKPKKEARPS